MIAESGERVFSLRQHLSQKLLRAFGLRKFYDVIMQQHQFRLRTLLIAVTVLCALLSVAVWDLRLFFLLFPAMLFAMGAFAARRLYRLDPIRFVVAGGIAATTGTPAVWFGLILLAAVFQDTELPGAVIHVMPTGLVYGFMCSLALAVICLLYWLVDDKIRRRAEVHGRNDHSRSSRPERESKPVHDRISRSPRHSIRGERNSSGAVAVLEWRRSFSERAAYDARVSSRLLPDQGWVDPGDGA